MKTYLCIDIGGTSIKYAILNEEGSIIEKKETPTPLKSIHALYETLDGIILPIQNQIEGIAISMPGRIDNKSGFVYTSGALSNFLLNTPFKDILEKRYQKKVTIENDGKCALLAETWLGNLRGVKNGIVLVIGTGLGGGIVLNGEPYRGTKGSAGEFSAILSDYKQSFDLRYVWGLTTGVPSLIASYANKKNINAQTLDGKKFFDLLNHGDTDAKEVFSSFIESLLSGILSIQAILDVEKVCIGGGISAQEILINELNQAFDRYFNAYGEITPVQHPIIGRCQFRNNANLIGALKNYLDNN